MRPENAACLRFDLKLAHNYLLPLLSSMMFFKLPRVVLRFALDLKYPEAEKTLIFTKEG